MTGARARRRSRRGLRWIKTPIPRVLKLECCGGLQPRVDSAAHDREGPCYDIGQASIHNFFDMDFQPKFKSQTTSTLFADGRADATHASKARFHAAPRWLRTNASFTGRA